MFKTQLLEDYEIGWRAGGAITRENEGPEWMRRHIIAMRTNDLNTYAESAQSLRERPAHQMM